MKYSVFFWFVAITMSLVLRSDKLDVTSVIRGLALRPDYYFPMLYFFRASCASHVVQRVGDAYGSVEIFWTDSFSSLSCRNWLF